MATNYFDNRNMSVLTKLRSIRMELPYLCNQFFVGIENATTPLTRLNYAYDFRLFFNFLYKCIRKFDGLTADTFTEKDLNNVTQNDIEEFLEYISYYKDENNRVIKNNEKGKARKLCSIRSLFKYLYCKNVLSTNVAAKIISPKIHTKEIIRMNSFEVDKLFEVLDTGENLSDRERKYLDKTRTRDYAILTLFLATGIRISELVGINVSDVDFKNNAFTVTRKGGNRVILYFSDEVKEALSLYLEERMQKEEPPILEPLFLSQQKRRISVRAVENLVEKYTQCVTTVKKISPHKLRSTYGTNLYRETKDIYVVAEVLGHKDINTTKKHYAAISEDIKREASTKVVLHKKESITNDNNTKNDGNGEDSD